MISRTFELSLPVGGGKGSSKRITYTNPYPHKKTFTLLTNMPDLLQFKESIIDVEGGAEHTIGLKFSPVMKNTNQPIPDQLMVFNIYDIKVVDFHALFQRSYSHVEFMYSTSSQHKLFIRI
jgi:hypothetical protein